MSRDVMLLWRRTSFRDFPADIDDLITSYGSNLPVIVLLVHPIAVIYFTDRAR